MGRGKSIRFSVPRGPGRQASCLGPLIPGYGDSEEAPTIRDMLDFTLHTWDVTEAVGRLG